MNRNNSMKRLTSHVILVVFLAICLCVSTFALMFASVNDTNVFVTGNVGISLKTELAGNKIIGEDEFLFEPGMTVEKSFLLENVGTTPIYYRLYFVNVEGDLADILEITIRDEDKVIYKGIMSQMVASVTKWASYDDAGVVKFMTLDNKESRHLTISFHYPKDSGNEGKNTEAKFDLWAEAVQVENNPNPNLMFETGTGIESSSATGTTASSESSSEATTESNTESTTETN